MSWPQVLRLSAADAILLIAAILTALLLLAAVIVLLMNPVLRWTSGWNRIYPLYAVALRPSSELRRIPVRFSAVHVRGATLWVAAEPGGLYLAGGRPLASALRPVQLPWTEVRVHARPTRVGPAQAELRLGPGGQTRVYLNLEHARFLEAARARYLTAERGTMR
ncbi:hypothetical protein HNR42_003286 [Deinobacterium chartae]|uniref:Uncharacterized protein n=1 Tax=Deinobacterium chartae TaxID=521158 RepID=A0A841I5V0_9DEIO|nr:hypothetical protein [Deinobacterium chartae]MBB6099828.1 hypothetical protein [Deinobacterium chartae]